MIQNNFRIEELRKIISRCELLLISTQKNSNRIGLVRLVVFMVAVVSTIFSYYTFSLIVTLVVLCISLSIFVFISILQTKIITQIKKQKKWIEIKKSYLARAKLDWDNICPPKIFDEDELTFLAIDLDITGSHSLHQLIDFSASDEGSKLLRFSLLNSLVEPTEVIERQNLIKELLSKSFFRDRFLLVNSFSGKQEINTQKFLEFLGISCKTDQLRLMLKILTVLCVFSLISIILFISGNISAKWLILSIIYFGFYFFNKSLFEKQVSEIELLRNFLQKNINIFEFVESVKYKEGSLLKKLCSPLTEQGNSAVKKLKTIDSIISFLTLRANPFVWIPLTTLLPVDYFFAYKLEKLKDEIRTKLPSWLEVLNKLEVFVSLSNFAYLNPEYVFPNPLDKEEIYLSVKGIAHPLVSKEKKTSNDYSINGIGRIDVITGSNMSGKSTFLRTIGINLCLANAGAPVNASSFCYAGMKLFTCIRISDSVTDGISYFYAEVKRLKRLLDEFNCDGIKPILFLIDEIFKGTNNIERLKGSEAMIRKLVLQNGAGLISTHDLELTKLAGFLPSVKNYHFKEEIENSQMKFNYKIHEGPCPSTNAIKIMQLNGLPV